MTKETLIFVLGLLVLLVPQLGIPNDWKEYFLFGAGVLLMIFGYLLRRAAYLRSIENNNGERMTESYVESNPSVANKDPYDPIEV